MFFENQDKQNTPSDQLEISFNGEYGQIVELEVAFAGRRPC